MTTEPRLAPGAHDSPLLTEAIVLLHNVQFATYRSAFVRGEHVSVNVSAWLTTTEGTRYLDVPNGDESPPDRTSPRAELLISCKSNDRRPVDWASVPPIFVLPADVSLQRRHVRLDPRGTAIVRGLTPGQYRLLVPPVWLREGVSLITRDALDLAQGERQTRLAEWRERSSQIFALPAGAVSLGPGGTALPATPDDATAPHILNLVTPRVIENEGGALRVVLTPRQDERNLRADITLAGERYLAPRAVLSFTELGTSAVVLSSEVALSRSSEPGLWQGVWLGEVSLRTPSQLFVQILDADSASDPSSNPPSGSDTAK